MELYSYQREALNKLKSGSVLVGGVGSGKSITAIAYFFEKECGGREDLACVARPKDLYIITTAHKRDTMEWDKEFSIFGLATNRDFSIGNIQVTVDSWNNIQKYISVQNAFFIFDEQRVVGSGAWVKAFLKITKRNRWILLSATPGDTWIDYIPVFIANRFYTSRSQFLRQHVIFNPYSKYPKIDGYLNESKLESIRKRIFVIMKNDKRNTRHVSMVRVSYNADIYKTIFKDRWNPYSDEPIENVSQLCYLLRKTINTDESRILELLHILNKHDRVIIFYNLSCELEVLRSLKDRDDFPADIFISEWNGQKHEPVPDTKRWLYLVQYTAGAEGWNCTSTNAMVLFSLNYSYKIMEQAFGRIDRVNNIYHDLYYYQFISNAPIDKAILHAISSKKNFNETMFVRT